MNENAKRMGGNPLKGLLFIGVAIAAVLAILNLVLTGIGLAGSIVAIGANILVFVVVLFFIINLIARGTGLGFVWVRNNKVGIPKRNFLGRALPLGQIIARDPRVVGTQAETLLPGLYWFMPIVWDIKIVDTWVIPSGQIGEVFSKDGVPLGDNMFARVVECKNFQDALAFFNDGAVKEDGSPDYDAMGQRGFQRAILPPGEYRINTEVFTINLEDETNIESGSVGVVTATDGQNLPDEYMIAPIPVDGDNKIVDHRSYQDPELFAKYGFKGVQQITLNRGRYRLNKQMFKVDTKPIKNVPPGYVGVVVSNIGQQVKGKEAKKTSVIEISGEIITAPEEVVLTQDINERGVYELPITTSDYNVNEVAMKIIFVPISAIRIDWRATEDARKEARTIPVDSETKMKIEGVPKEATESYKYREFTVISKDGFEMKVNAQLIARILAKDAAYIISRFGSVENLIKQVIYAQMNSTLYNIAGERDATDFILKRYEVQKKMVDIIAEEFKQHRVIVQSLLIGDVGVNEELLTILRNTMLAKKQQEQYVEQTKANREEINVKEQKALADLQPVLQKSIIGVKVADNEAQAVMIRADATGYELQTIGIGEGQAYNAKSLAVGKGNLAGIEMMRLAAKYGIPLVPRVAMMAGKDGESGNFSMNAISALAALSLDEQLGEKFDFPLLTKPDHAEKSDEKDSTEEKIVLPHVLPTGEVIEPKGPDSNELLRMAGAGENAAGEREDLDKGKNSARRDTKEF